MPYRTPLRFPKGCQLRPKRFPLRLRLTMPAILTTLRHLDTPQACGQFGGFGVGGLINERGIPPITQPKAQCWFQMFELGPEAPSTMMDNLVMCRREQLSEQPPGEFRLFFSETMTRRACSHCDRIQFKDGSTTLGGRPRFKVCSECNAHYCNEECQRADWSKHQLICRRRRRSDIPVAIV